MTSPLPPGWDESGCALKERWAPGGEGRSFFLLKRPIMKKVQEEAGLEWSGCCYSEKLQCFRELKSWFCAGEVVRVLARKDARVQTVEEKFLVLLTPDSGFCTVWMKEDAAQFSVVLLTWKPQFGNTLARVTQNDVVNGMFLNSLKCFYRPGC